MTDTQREFEKWATNHRDVHSICYFTLKKENGSYISGMTNDAWEGWQAGYQAALAHSQQYEAVGGVFILKQPPNRGYPSATFNTTNIREGSILYVKREAITNRKD